MTRLAGAILGVRLAEYVKSKYGARLDAASWDMRAAMKFLETEADIMFRESDEVIPDPTLDDTLDEAYTILFDPEGPLADVIDLDAYRHRGT